VPGFSGFVGAIYEVEWGLTSEKRKIIMLDTDLLAEERQLAAPVRRLEEMRED